MSGFQSFLKNVGLLTLANFGTKILSFLLVPLYTSVLTTSEYGTYDIALNTVGILIPFLTQNVVDAVLRFSMDEGRRKGDVLGVGIRHLLLSLIPIIVILGVNRALNISEPLNKMALFVALLYISQASSGVILYFARGLDRFREIAISSVMCTAVTICLNILLLAVFDFGLSGYFLANVAGPLVQSIYLVANLKIGHVDPIHVDKGLEREMLAYSRPMIANSVAWWINSVADRYVVTWFCGIGANGVYSAASKIPSILSVVQSIVGQAWTISAVEEFDSEDSKGFFSNMYAGYNCAMVIICSLIISCNLILAKLLYANGFYSAWQFAPFLTISTVFGALAGYVGGILAAVRDTREFARSSVVGALLNIAINMLAVPIIGPLGAAIATLISYWAAWLIRMRTLKKYLKLRINSVRDNLSYLILVLQGALFFILSDVFQLYFCELLLMVVIAFMYQKEVRVSVRKLKSILVKE